jgi:hypothetical protein
MPKKVESPATVAKTQGDAHKREENTRFMPTMQTQGPNLVPEVERPVATGGCKGPDGVKPGLGGLLAARGRGTDPCLRVCGGGWGGGARDRVDGVQLRLLVVGVVPVALERKVLWEVRVFDVLDP